MIIIREIKKSNLSYYEYEIKEGKRILIRKNIRILSRIIESDIGTYFVIFNENYEINKIIFKYLNYSIKGESYNSKSQALSALKTLVSFETILGKNIASFDWNDFILFKSFLRGENSNGLNIQTHLITRRSSETINQYLSCIRKYLTIVHIECGAIFQTFMKKFNLYNSSVYSKTLVDKYEISEKTPPKNEVPFYISLEEFLDLIHLVRKKYDIRAEIIIRLMYETGMRIGEVLGLTADDVCMTKSNTKYYPTVYIRNRVCDRKDQQAKTCMKIQDRSQYNSKEYLLDGYGYQTVYITKELYELINAYIEIKHAYVRERFKDKYYKETIADRVPGAESDDINYYIFLNKDGEPLGVSGWNKSLKKMFTQVGIVIDKGRKEKDLNHRFRHGFAMFQVKHMGVNDLEQLRIKMRHKNIETVKIYLQYTQEDKIAIKQNFEKHLYKLIPELKQMTYGE